MIQFRRNGPLAVGSMFSLSRLFFFFIGCSLITISEVQSQSIVPTQITINGQPYKDSPIEIGSPYVSLDVNYQIDSSERFRNLRVFSGHNCSISNENVEIFWCSKESCRIGGQSDFDITFESKGAYYHSFDTNPRDIDFSVEVNRLDQHGAIVSSCTNASLKLKPCDSILEVIPRQKGDDKTIELQFLDSLTGEPVDNVEVFVSSGPVPVLTRPAPGVVIMHTSPKKNSFSFSFSRSLAHRFSAGPFSGQHVEGGLKKLKVSLCTQ